MPEGVIGHVLVWHRKISTRINSHHNSYPFHVCLDAVEKLKVSSGTQIIEINDQDAAKGIVEKTLIKPAKYAERVTPGRFNVSRDGAFGSQESTIAVLLIMCNQIS